MSYKWFHELLKTIWYLNQDGTKLLLQRLLAHSYGNGVAEIYGPRSVVFLNRILYISKINLFVPYGI